MQQFVPRKSAQIESEEQKQKAKARPSKYRFYYFRFQPDHLYELEQDVRGRRGSVRNGTLLSASKQPKQHQLQRQQTRNRSAQPKGTVVSSHSSNQNQRQSHLFHEFQDILNHDSMSSSESEDSFLREDLKQNKIKKLQLDQRYRKESTSQLGMKSSKRIGPGMMAQNPMKESLRESRKLVGMKESMMTKKSMNRQFSSQSRIKGKRDDDDLLSSRKSHFQMKSSQNMRESHFQSLGLTSIKSIKDREKSKQSVTEILDQSNFTEEEKKKYLHLLDQLEDQVQTITPSKRAKFQTRVRRTFIEMVNRFHQNNDPLNQAFNNASEMKQSSEFPNDEMSMFSDVSIFKRDDVRRIQSSNFSPNMQVRHPQSFGTHKKMSLRIDQIISESKSIIPQDADQTDKIKQLMEFYIAEMKEEDDDEIMTENYSMNESEILDSEGMSQSSGSLKNDATIVQFRREIKNYNQKAIRDPFNDYYSLVLHNAFDYEALRNHYDIYSDGYPLLNFRKTLVYVVGISNIVAYKIVTHKTFIFIVLSAILINLYLFSVEHLQTNSKAQLHTINQLQRILLYFYIAESSLKLFGLGFVKFSQNFWNFYDLALLILYAMYQMNSKFFPIDISYFRLMRILLFLGLFIKPLRIMIISLSEAFKFLLESVLIMVIFSVFFTLQCLHLFNGLFRNTCLDLKNGLYGPHRFCGYETCGKDGFCGEFVENPRVADTFDNFGYAWGQIIRIIVMNEFHEPMYWSMATFHPFSFILFISTMFIAGIFGANLIIAVIKIYYSETVEKYEFEEIDEYHDQEDRNEVNLMVLKSFGLYQQLQQSLQQYLSRKKFIGMHTTTDHLSEKYNNYQAAATKSDQQIKADANPRKKHNGTRKSITKIKMKKVRHFLSARMNREYNEKQDHLKGIISSSSKKSKFANLLEQFSLRNILLPRRTLQAQQAKTIDQNEEFKNDEMCLPIMHRLKNSDVLSWRVVLKTEKYLEYISTSEIDVTSQVQKARRKEDKRAREFEFIKKSSPQHIFIITEKEAIKSKRTQIKDMSMTYTRMRNLRRHKFPILRSQNIKRRLTTQGTNIIRPQGINIVEVESYRSKSPSASVQSNHDLAPPFSMPSKIGMSQRAPMKASSLHNSASIYTVETQRSKTHQKLILNGMEYDFEDLRQMIVRPLGKENLASDHTNELEDLYVEFRKYESQQQLILKHNWSAEDILFRHYQLSRKAIIFKSLNRIDKIVWMRGITGFLKVCRKYVIMAMRLKGVEFFFDLCILLNIIILSLDGVISGYLLLYVNDLITILLGIELLMKLISLDLKKFLQKPVNLFETFIVLSCISEIVIDQIIMLPPGLSTQLDLFLQFSRGFKAILFYRIIKYNKFAVQMAVITQKVFPSFSNLLILMFFVVLIFSYFGIDLYRGRFPQNQELGQMHPYEDIFKAWMSVFMIGTNDDLYGVIVLGAEYGEPISTLIYSTLVLYFLNFMTFGLVIAIILDGFSKYLIKEQEEQKIKYDPNHVNTEVSDEYKELAEEGITLNTQEEQSAQSKTEEEILFPAPTNINNDDVIIAESPHKQIFSMSHTQIQSSQQQLPATTRQLELFQVNFDKFLNMRDAINFIVERDFKEFEYFEQIESEYSLFIFSKENTFRQLCYQLIVQKWYQWVIHLTLLTSLINMAVFTFIDHESSEHGNDSNIDINVIENIEIVMNTIVFVDGLIKIVAMGCVYSKGCFAREIWRTLDFIYVTTFLLSQFITIQPFFRIGIGYFKYLRPMRFLNMFQGIKEVKDALAESLPDLINVLVVQMLVWLIFAIFGVILYKGKLGYCGEPINFGVGKEECHHHGEEWKIYPYNFEDILQAISALYIICTLDLWGEIFQTCYNSASEIHGPMPFANQWGTYIFFFLFVMIGSFFFLGFFTGILLIYFQENRAKLINEELTHEQIMYISISETILKEEPQYSSPPTSFFRYLASEVLRNTYYRQAIVPLLFFNTVDLALFHWNQDYHQFRLINNIHHAFACTQIFDSFLKMLAFGITRYFGYGWRRLEFSIALCSLIDLILDKTLGWTDEYYYETVNDRYFILLRLAFVLRDIRILLIIQEFKGLSRLMRVLSFSLPYLMKILSLFVAILLCYAYAGCYLFGNIEKGEIMDEWLNFKNVFLAMLTLFKCATRNNWRIIFLDCTDHNPYCKDDPSQCGQPQIVAMIYFYSFILISSLVVFQLFILALVEQFESFYNSQNNVIQTYIENIDKFRTVWCKYSQESKGQKMHTSYLAHFLLGLGEPLGAQKGDNIWDAAKSISNFRIKADSMGYVHFKEVLYETIRYAYQDAVFRTGTEGGIKQMKNLDKQIRFQLHHRRLSLQDRRQSVREHIQLKGNFNILQEYIYVLLVFRVWSSYSSKIIAKAHDQRLNCQKFTDSIKVSFHEKQNQNYTHIEEDEEKYKYDAILAVKHLLTDSASNEPQPVLMTYQQTKNIQKKQKVRLFVKDNPDQGRQLDEMIVFEPMDNNHKQDSQEQNNQPKVRKSNLKTTRTFNNPIQTKNDVGSRLENSMMIGAGLAGDSQFQSLTSALNVVSAVRQNVPNPMNIESDSSLSSDPEYYKAISQQIEDELQMKSIRNSDQKLLGKPQFMQQDSFQMSNSSNHRFKR